jgi:hypothetical protein
LRSAIFAFDKFVLAPQREATQREAARQQGRSEAIAESYGDKSIAVLPFTDLSENQDPRHTSPTASPRSCSIC